ncbi:DUF4249 domain-containing protein [Gangjinia marincola]|uniref:DUF4249 domain-containing protein n=1 Tax=Gangjinia marincola TaxID=578463 RepID=A0ABN1MET4_9FLAO
MKKFIVLFLVILSITACEEVVDIDVPFDDERLVIDAAFKLIMSENEPTVRGEVRLLKTAPFFDDELPPVLDADVFITDLTTGQIIEFTDANNDGVYSAQTEEIFQLNTTYELTVIAEGNTYKASTQLVPTVPIDTIELGDTVIFDEDDKEVKITFTDIGAREDYYLFDFGFDNLLGTTEDRFYDGQEFTFSYFYEDLNEGTPVTISIIGVDKQHYDFLNLLIEQSGQDGGGPFEAPPATVRGNIINTTNTDDFALGYFSISETYEFSIVVE